MKYRVYNPETDKTSLINLCNKHNIRVPEKGMLFVAVNENNELCAVIGLKTEVFIEPLIGDNLHAANKLFIMMEGVIAKEGFSAVRCLCSPDQEGLFNRVGFNLIESKKIIMEKEY